MPRILSSISSMTVESRRLGHKACRAALPGAPSPRHPQRFEEKAMKIGVPTEVKEQEYRVAMTPAGVRELTEHGH
ncbi:MAG TPA: hypothetical protein VHS74_09080, partial [Solirubrobacterales bacterium]|nr:hypothetical protein [Solirubrobacterales bacterium]